MEEIIGYGWFLVMGIAVFAFVAIIIAAIRERKDGK